MTSLPHLTSAPPRHTRARSRTRVHVQAVVGGTVWMVFAELRERRKQMLQHHKLSLPGMRSSVSFAMLGGTEIAATSIHSRPDGGYSDVAIGAVMGMVCTAAAGGVQPLRAVAMQALAGSSFAALAAGSLEMLFVADGGDETDERGAGGRGRESRPNSVLDAPAHALILAGFAAAPVALLLASLGPIPPALAPPELAAEPSARGSVCAVQLLAIVGSALWSAMAMHLLLLLSSAALGGGGEGAPAEAAGGKGAADPSLSGRLPSFPSHAPGAHVRPHLTASHSSSPSRAGDGDDLTATPGRMRHMPSLTPVAHLGAGAPAHASTSACLGGSGSGTPPHARQPGGRAQLPATPASAVSVDVPVFLPNGDKAMLSVRVGDEIEELVAGFCARHRLSRDCAPAIYQYLVARYTDARLENAACADADGRSASNGGAGLARMPGSPHHGRIDLTAAGSDAAKPSVDAAHVASR